MALTVMRMNYESFVKLGSQVVLAPFGGFLEKQFCGWYFGGTWGWGR